MRQFKHHIFWIIPSILYLISSQFSVINVDGVRDYLAAYNIAVNNRHTLIGPEMAFSFNIGPIWYYILALPLMISKSWAFMSFFISIFTALKFFFAYRLGKLLLGTEFAILLIFSLMLASFTIVQQIIFTHTNLIELLILVTIYYTWVSSDKFLNWFIIGILFGLAIHVHPTAGVVSFWIVLKLYESQSRLKNGAFVFFGLITVFSPLIVYEFISDFENIKGALSYLSHNTDSTDYLGLIKLAYGSIFVTALGTYKMLFPPIVAYILFIFHCLLIAIAFIVGIFSITKLNNETKKLFIKSLLFFIFTLLFLFFIRKTTPWYMTYSISLSFSLLISVLLWSIYKWFKLKNMPLILYTFGMIIFISSMVSLMYKLSHNQIKPPALGWNNVRTTSSKLITTDNYEIPAYLAEEHAEYLCKNSPVTLQGPYAALIQSHSGIEYLSACNSNALFYGPTSDDLNVIFALPTSLSKFVITKPIHIIGNTHFYDIRSISNKQKLHHEKFLSEYDYTITTTNDWGSKHNNAVLNHGNYLTITKILGYKAELVINHVKVDNRILKPIAHTNYSTLYSCESCDKEKSIWEVDYSESVKGMTNIVTF